MSLEKSKNTGTGPSDDTTYAISAQDVHITYEDGTEAVQGLSLEVERGEFFGFLGPNGAGKTTTIKSLVTLLHPTQGAIQVEGFDTVEDPLAVRESVGYMAQETSIDRELTPRENLRLACELYGVSKSERADRIEKLLDLVDLQDVADERSEKFSGGMKKRLDAATVLVHRPPVVFLDEPTTGLDPEARRRLWDYFKRINEEGTTVFLTTQYLEEADHLCDRLSLIQDGQVVATGAPETLKSSVGGDLFEVTLADPSKSRTERAIRAVRKLDQFAEASFETTENGFTVRTERDSETTSEFFAALNGANITVTDFNIQSPTLDDVFLALTADESADVASGTVTESAPEVSL
ncbi:ATP-binding cassette domain-containing protein [Haloarcula salinisoli]|uniref:ATP-binding cassette domain-containing protein n=1 Tax=Haloarcula salinisoli TaxID=2487746 RepID=A0A8J7YMM4_9EURY|nr:ATP-binding cassette domain-containing protein [Halomicroarcula salinisoli]MBX0288596.1 ATP-binding cassette domain-containing protein [Halomicroarcula salinisoli]MBX0306024.1 ATP-binding cassette domain-containing protein [Halomicroarcula salinisoli]